jgi:hypothetical protein
MAWVARISPRTCNEPARSGVPDKTIQAILRHANVSVTMNSYVKTLDAQSIAAMQQLEKLVDPKLLLVGAVVV